MTSLPSPQLAQAHIFYDASLAALVAETVEAPETALLLAQACLEWVTPETDLAMWVSAHLICSVAHLAQDLGDPDHEERRACQHLHAIFLVLAGIDPALALHSE